MKEKITLITAYKDLGRGEWKGTLEGRGAIPNYIARDRQTYIDRFLKLSKLNNDIYVFVDDDVKAELENKVSDNVAFCNIDDVWYNPLHQSLLKDIENIQQKQEFIDFVDNPTMPEYWCAPYVLINYLKPYFISMVNNCYGINHGNLAWVDFGYVRDDFDYSQKTFVYDNKGITFFSNYLHAPNDVSIEHLVKTGNVLIRGPLFIVESHLTEILKYCYHISMQKIIDKGLVDDDQTVMYMVSKLFDEYSDSKVNVVYDGLGWFDTIKRNLI